MGVGIGGGGCVFRGQELCESPGGRPELPVPNGPYGLCGRKATLNDENDDNSMLTTPATRQGWKC